MPTVAGYQGIGDWDFRVSGTSQASPGTGPGGVAWPTSPGNCTDQWFQVRWHAVNPGATFVAEYGTAGTPPSKSAPESNGWLSIDGCQIPKWTLKSGTGDVAVVAEAFQPNS